MMRMPDLWNRLVPVVFFMALPGCADTLPDETESSDPASSPTPVVTAEPVEPEDQTPSIAELRRRLGANENAEFHKAGGEIRIANLYQSGVKDLDPLAGLPLRVLDLRELPISDIEPLAGMPLEQLYMEKTQVEDIGPLAGMPLRELWLTNTPVADLRPLAGMRLQQLNLIGTEIQNLEALSETSLGTLWIRETAVSDLSPLAGKSLVSLDAQQTPVTDLTPLARITTLKRLNIAQTKVTDLSPLKDLQLERLIFTPSQIQTGLDVVRQMKSLRELDVTFREPKRLTPDEFWPKFDAGEFQ